MSFNEIIEKSFEDQLNRNDQKVNTVGLQCASRCRNTVRQQFSDESIVPEILNYCYIPNRQ